MPLSKIDSSEVEALPLHGGEKLIVGILLCDRPVLERWFDALNALQFPVPGGTLIARSAGQNKMREICVARERITQRALKVGARYVFFLDDDVIVPADCLTKLHAALEANPRAKVIGAVYPQLGWKNANVPAAWDARGDYLQTVPIGQVISCGGVGSGCMLLDLSVLPQISKPWYSFEARGLNNLWKGDDVLLCDKIRVAGFQVLLHGGVICDHQDARVASSDFKGQDPYKVRYHAGQYVDAANNVLLRSQIEH